MKLTDLHPKWFTVDGRRVGFTFDCPCGGAGCKGSVYVSPPDGGPPPAGVPVWARTGDDFDTMTLSPSIRIWGHECQGDHWHGYLRGGVMESC